MISFDQLMSDSTSFQTLVRTLAGGFRNPRFQSMTIDTFNATKDFKGVSAFNGRIPMASSIDASSGKPVIGTEKPLDLSGTMPTFGNKFTFTGEEFNKISEIERAIAGKVANPKALIGYLYNYFERIAVSPLISIDKCFFEAISNGTSTITKDTLLSGVPFSIDWQIEKATADTDWDDADNADGIKDLKDIFKNNRDNHGVILEEFVMNPNTFEDLQNQKSVKDIISSYYRSDGLTVGFTGVPSLEVINNILKRAFLLPPIRIEDYMISKYSDDGASIGSTSMAFQDNRVAGVTKGAMGTYLWTPADEQRRPDKIASYQDVNHVLIRTEPKRGKQTIESELSGICVPNMNNELVILKTKA